MWTNRKHKKIQNTNGKRTKFVIIKYVDVLFEVHFEVQCEVQFELQFEYNFLRANTFMAFGLYSSSIGEAMDCCVA